MISDAELRAIVEKVVQRTMHGPEGRVETQPQPAPEESTGNSPQKTVALGADHGGYKMKEMLKAHLTEAGYQVNDCGTHSTESVDYPDFAFAVARSGEFRESPGAASSLMAPGSAVAWPPIKCLACELPCATIMRLR